MYQKYIRPLLFQVDPEQVHRLTIQLLRLSGILPPISALMHSIFHARSHNTEKVKAFGLEFSNHIGLAAGYDKDGLAWRGLAALGFGHIEVGTVTPRPQEGNPKPRIFRIPEEKAIINRMGFPGRGADFVARQIPADRSLSSIILGVNIGKNKDTPNEEAVRDYLYLFEKFSLIADYVAVNVSSPNTVGLRRLQAREYLEDLLQHLSEARLKLTLNNREGSPVYRPVLVKLAPDLTNAELDDALAAIQSTGMDGVIATNTTIGRDTLRSSMRMETGGMSGSPLTKKSRSIVGEIHRRTQGRLPIVGVGGIMKPEDAKAMLDAGASLVQLYTGLIYAGPGLVRDMIELVG